MSFKKKRIKSSNKKKFLKKTLTWIRSKRTALVTLAIVLTSIFAVRAMVLGTGVFSNNGASLLSIMPLKQDDFGHTNILFLGVAGDNEEGGNLSDSIMVISINPKNPAASFLSVPRDLFISSDVGDRKINEIYALARHKGGDKKGLETVKKAMTKFTGVDIHYAAVIRFSVFEEVVDALDGVDIFVPQGIQDPFYPADNYAYQTFIVRKGMNHFDGKTALKYARSRKTTSDYDRANRQQDLLMAMRKKAVDQGVLTDMEKLKRFYQIFKKNINTDIGIPQLISLAKVAVTIDYKNSVTAVLNDNPSTKDGFLYTPAREFYGGQFVLLPENFRDTQLYMRLVLGKPHILLENAQISVLNGSMTQGLAKKTAIRLRRFGFHVIETGNYDTSKPVFRTFINNQSGDKTYATAKMLSEILEAELVAPIETEDRGDLLSDEDLIDIQIVLGTS